MKGQERQTCNACGGTGRVKQPQVKTEYVTRTIHEYVPVQVGDHTEYILQTRTWLEPILKTEWIDVVCAACQGEGKV